MRILIRLAALSLLLAGFTLDAAETVHLVAPDLADANIIGYNVGLRPYRSSGIRIEAEQHENKSLIHNYGHGGAGITLSWGSAIEALKVMDDQFAPSTGSTIAVIGSGVNGLTVAHQLLDRGYKVRIYAKEFPPQTTSEVAAGLWYPASVAIGESLEAQRRFENIKNTSYDFFYDLATAPSPEFHGAWIADGYAFYGDREPRTGPGISLVDVHFDNGLEMPAEHRAFIMIETPTYMNDLMQKAWEKGADFVSQVISDRSDLLKFEEDIIFNCMGLGARDVFDDQDMKPIRGQLVYFKAQEDVNYLASAPSPKEGPTFTMLFPYKDKLILGGSFEEGEETRVLESKIVERIVEDAKRLFAPKTSSQDEL